MKNLFYDCHICQDALVIDGHKALKALQQHIFLKYKKEIQEVMGSCVSSFYFQPEFWLFYKAKKDGFSTNIFSNPELKAEFVSKMTNCGKVKMCVNLNKDMWDRDPDLVFDLCFLPVEEFESLVNMIYEGRDHAIVVFEGSK